MIPKKNRRSRKRWTKEDDQQLLDNIAKYGRDWSTISILMKRTVTGCTKRLAKIKCLNKKESEHYGVQRNDYFKGRSDCVTVNNDFNENNVLSLQSDNKSTNSNRNSATIIKFPISSSCHKAGSKWSTDEKKMLLEVVNKYSSWNEITNNMNTGRSLSAYYTKWWEMTKKYDSFHGNHDNFLLNSTHNLSKANRRWTSDEIKKMFTAVNNGKNWNEIVDYMDTGRTLDAYYAKWYELSHDRYRDVNNNNTSNNSKRKSLRSRNWKKRKIINRSTDMKSIALYNNNNDDDDQIVKYKDNIVVSRSSCSLSIDGSNNDNKGNSYSNNYNSYNTCTHYNDDDNVSINNNVNQQKMISAQDIFLNKIHQTTKDKWTINEIFSFITIVSERCLDNSNSSNSSSSSYSKSNNKNKGWIDISSQLNKCLQDCEIIWYVLKHDLPSDVVGEIFKDYWGSINSINN